MYKPTFTAGPFYSRADVKFSLNSATSGGLPLHFVDSILSTDGISGLAWGGLDEERHFGQSVIVDIRLKSGPLVDLKVRATISREYTEGKCLMGCKFELDDYEARRLRDYISKYGQYSGNFVRSQPRISARPDIGIFPLQAIVVTGEGGPSVADPNRLVVYDIEDLTSTGALLKTENLGALETEPGDRVQVFFQPRGDLHHCIRLHGLVRRIRDVVRMPSKNMQRAVGIQFTIADSTNREAFLALMHAIMSRLESET